MQKVNPDLPNEKFLNTPENCLVNIRKQQKIILDATKLIKGLKKELDAHKENGTIMSKFTNEGVTATRTYKPSWIYLDKITNLKDKLAANTDEFYFNNDYHIDEYKKRHDQLTAEIKELENG